VNKNKLRYIGFCVSFVFVLFVSVYTFLFESDTPTSDLLNISASAEKGNLTSLVTTVTKAISEKDSSKEGQSITETAASTTVLGKILEKTINPQSSNLTYKNLYVKNNTDLSPNLKNLLESKLAFSVEENDEPQVLILHTHATESYMLNNNDTYGDGDKPRNVNNELNMVAIGNIVQSRLNGAGIKTLHDTTQHDNPSYNDSYSRAAKTINSYKSKYKSIKIIIDLHRDSICNNQSDKTKLTKVILGKKAAQIMIVMGSQSGSVKNFPNYEENLKLAFKVQERIETMYPGLARGLYLMPRNYNESLSTGSMLIEIGTDANTLEEAKYSAELLSDCLVSLLKEL